MIYQKEITLPAFQRGFHLITEIIEENLENLPGAGLVQIFIKHTSAALCINENADRTVRTDLEKIYNKLVPENESFYTHNAEGPDDMPAHAKAILTSSSVTIPVTEAKLNLGTWQGIYLCEFRNNGGRRKIVITVFS